MLISIKLKNAREAQGLSQRDLADRAGLSSGYIGMVEANKATPSVKALRKIAEALNVEAAFFLEENPSVLFDEYIDHFNLNEKEFLSKQKSRPWIALAKELDEGGLSPEEVRKLLKLVMDLSKK